MNNWTTEDFHSSGNTLYDATMVDICHTFVQTYVMYNIKSEL